MNNLVKIMQKPILWALIIVFIAFYPMLISIYVFLPLLIGVMGYLFMRGLETNKFFYILVALIYFTNLEANLALPFFLTTITTLFVYAVFYHHLNYFRKCTFCSAVLSVLLIDFIYLGTLLSYDFIFQTNNIVLDNILIYSLVVDLLVVVLI
jgi:hypothetical protein